MLVEAIVPWAPTPGREPLLRYVRSYLESFGIPVRLATGPNDDGFNHGRAINGAVSESTADVLLICDADTVPGIDLHDTIGNVAAGTFAWAMPERYAQLSEEATARALRKGLFYDERDTTWVGENSWAGVQVVTRAGFSQAGGWDERFVRWGADDCCFGLAMDALVGRHTRVGGTAIHLWHDRTHSTPGHGSWQAQQAVLAEYMEAANDPVAMMRVIGRR